MSTKMIFILEPVSWGNFLPRVTSRLAGFATLWGPPLFGIWHGSMTLEILGGLIGRILFISFAFNTGKRKRRTPQQVVNYLARTYGVKITIHPATAMDDEDREFV